MEILVSGDWETWRTHFADTAKLYINSPKSISASDLENAQKEMLASFSSYGFQEKGSFVEMVIDNEEETCQCISNCFIRDVRPRGVCLKHIIDYGATHCPWIVLFSF